MLPPDGSRERRLEDLIASAREARRRVQQTVRESGTVRQKSQTVLLEYVRGWARAEQLRELWQSEKPGRLQYSALARLQARLASMPVIEQAKGVLMAQCGWTADQAFDALRRASQRSNIRVRDLAAKIVADTAKPRAETGTPADRIALKPANGRRAMDAAPARQANRAAAG